MDFRWPGSQDDIERIQRERKRLAVERALRSKQGTGSRGQVTG